jgi:hypothetical protein
MLTLDDLVARFQTCTLPRAEWTHLAHLRVGAWHVHHFGAEAALARLRAGIRALNDSHGTANTDTGGYHETITVAYVRLLDDFLSACNPAQSLEDRVQAVVDGPLAHRTLLLRFWSKDLLMSPSARRGWVPPDLAPIAVPAEALVSAREPSPR